MKSIPQYHAFFNPVLKALKLLGGSGSLKEINDKVIELVGLSNEVVEQMHNSETSNQTELEYRLAWARTYLKQYGLIDNSSRGVWSLTKKAEAVHEVNPDEVVRHVRQLAKLSRVSTAREPEANTEVYEEIEADQLWKSDLHKILVNDLSAAAFERLVQRLLRESGFTQVEVIGRTGDGGIDGKGIAKIHGFLSFHVIFQCKRYQGKVTPSEIRDFRGAMVGRADKGLFITTGSFTLAAEKEATRDGAPPIDLIDGEMLAEKLKELKLGIKIEMVERVIVDPSWFRSI
jgi:restriction system protein